VVAVFVRIDRVGPDDVRMTEHPRLAHFVAQCPHKLAVTLELSLQHLDREDLTLNLEVGRAIHDTHAAGAELLFEHVAVAKRPADVGISYVVKFARDGKGDRWGNCYTDRNRPDDGGFSRLLGWQPGRVRIHPISRGKRRRIDTDRGLRIGR